MPQAVKVRKADEESTRSRSHSREESEQEEQSEEAEQSPDKAATMERLKAEGAVRVFPGMDAGPKPEAPEATEAPTAPQAATAPSAEVEASEGESEGVGTGISQDFHDRVKRETDAANNPKWYNLPQHISNARHGEWDLSKSRERSGNRKQDVNLEEDVRTNQIEKRILPGKFDIKQKAKNAVNDVIQNPGQTAAGMIPLVGKGIQQKMAEKYDVKERDLMRGIAATSTDESIQSSAASQAKALGTKITTGRVKAGIGTVTGIAGNIIPGAGQVAGAVGTAAGMIGDIATSGAQTQVKKARAREEARRAMGKKEFAGYENIDEFIGLEQQRHALVDAGKGKAGAAAPAIDGQDQVKRLTAHARGETEHHKHYKRRAKEVEQERAAAAKPKEEGTGLMSRMKKFFGRS
ncbi:hypothetical protein ACFPVX_15985 [Cohnella faecalis]|uniref:Uncharacterized protein n=1 Tax=Cohnella faecalis TaxID=2315694 RepID=A0A398CHQ8_9BACL|nr:hypothetical protein [Cohnella faecalis]RIE00659.1 hypothetical protein D3H35_27230 [Cohnella faecalis]